MKCRYAVPTENTSLLFHLQTDQSPFDSSGLMFIKKALRSLSMFVWIALPPLTYPTFQFSHCQ